MSLACGSLSCSSVCGASRSSAGFEQQRGIAGVRSRGQLLGFVSKEGASKYLYEGDFSRDSIKQFSEIFLAGELIPQVSEST